MNDPAMTTKTANRSRRRRLAIALVIVALSSGISFAVGYQVGLARQEKRLLNEFLVNAVNLGILDIERLRELTTDAGTIMENDAVSIHGRPGEP